MTYQPRDGSLGARLCAFFAANPDEELSNADIARKYDVPAANIAATLSAPLAHGFIARAGTGIYKAGPKLLAAKDAPPPQTSGFKHWLAQQGLDGEQGRDAGAPLPDPAALVIESGVPIPVAQSELMLRFAERFSEMKVGDSFVCKPEHAKKLVMAACKWGKAIGRRFVTRRTSTVEARVWRKE